MKRQLNIGSVFFVPLADGTRGLGQVVGREPEVLNSWTCAFSRSRLKEEDKSTCRPLTPDEVISVQFVTADLLKNGVWHIFGVADVTIPKSMFPYESTRREGWIGAKMIGSRNIGRFLAAFHGLEFWDEMADPKYYEKLLLPGVPVPSHVRKMKPNQSPEPMPLKRHGSA